MTIPRFFVGADCSPGVEARLEPEDVKHAVNVLRLKTGDTIELISDGKAWKATLSVVGRDAASARILEEISADSRELPESVVVVQALPKAQKMDYIVEKVTELGAHAIVPVRCARSYAGAEGKLERWRRIARAAAQQSRRLYVPRVEEPINWSTALERYATAGRMFVANESAPKGSLASAVQKSNAPYAHQTASAKVHLAIAVGPEGSFTEEELAQAKAAGCDFVSLGPTILRTETAALAMLAAVACAKAWW